MILEKSLTVVLLCLIRFSRHRGKEASQNWQAESLHRSLPAELEHLVPIKIQEKLPMLTLPCFGLWCNRQWQNLSHCSGCEGSYYQKHDQQLPDQLHRNTRGLFEERSHVSTKVIPWLNGKTTFMRTLSKNWYFSSHIANLVVDLALTVANPQSTLLIFSIDSTASLPSSKSMGSLVARYRYIALSISSAKKPQTFASVKITKPHTQGRQDIPWTNLTMLL